jgi:hypothetical protein
VALKTTFGYDDDVTLSGTNTRHHHTRIMSISASARHLALVLGCARMRSRRGAAHRVESLAAVRRVEGQVQHAVALPRLGVDVKVILMPPCIFCIDNH